MAELRLMLAIRLWSCAPKTSCLWEPSLTHLLPPSRPVQPAQNGGALARWGYHGAPLPEAGAHRGLVLPVLAPGLGSGLALPLTQHPHTGLTLPPG